MTKSSSRIFRSADPDARGAARPLLCLVLCVCFSQALPAADNGAPHANLTAAQIVDKHIAARGGLQAWRAVRTLSLAGKMDAGSGDSVARSERIARGTAGPSAKREHAAALAGAEKRAADSQVQLPFRLELKAPHKSRLEIDFAGKTAVQVFDGQKGWKLRPYLNRSDVEPFTADEAKASEDGAGDLTGPLVDYAAKGTKVVLDGIEPVEGRNAYKLKLTKSSGAVQYIWVDAQNFLDVKVEGAPRRMDGRMRNVWIYQRDFRAVQGLMMPFLYETAVDGGTQTHRMMIEKVSVNPGLDESRFTKPLVPVGPARQTTTAPPPTARE